MNARADDPAVILVDTVAQAKSRAPAVTACFHCGLNVPPESDFAVDIDQRVERMCCVGCMNVAQTIIGAGMADFYRQRVGYSEKFDPRSLPPSAASERPETAKRAVSDVSGASAETHLYLTGLRCAACVWLAEHTMGSLCGVE
ncbi:MAG: heavy metal translocating P-type ATPase metal-binding domain-containing protein, partial [Burkholderiales bacterium]